MQPALPSAVAPRGADPAALRGLFALVLALSVAAVVGAQPPKEPDKKEPPKPPEVKWPTEINGRDLAAMMKELEDPDPTVREFAARQLPAFGPPAQKGAVSKMLIERMTRETDPGVRYAVYGAVGAISFDAEADNKEALRLLIAAAETAGPGSAARLNAVQSIGLFGPKGYGAITAMAEGKSIGDPSYETRRTVATALGRIGFSETTGPNFKALKALADHLAKDPSASVRMEALQSIMLLGPPWAGVRKADDKVNPPLDVKSVAVIIGYMKTRVGDPKAKPPRPGLEKDKQVEIWARLVLMRFDPAEINEDNLEALARHLTGAEVGVKIQALNAIGIMGELAAKKLDAVRQVLNQENQPRPLTAAVVNVLVAMGAGAKPAVPDLRKLSEVAKKELAAAKAKEKAKQAGTDQDAIDQAALERSAADNWLKFIEESIKRIDAAKPFSPAELKAGDPPPKKG